MRIPRSAILFLSPCEDITAGTRHLLAPLLQPIPKRDRWAGHICHVDISLGLTKIEARTKMSSHSVSISCVMPTPCVCSVTFRLHDNKGTTFVSLYRLSRPQTPPTFLEKVHFSSMIHFILRVRKAKRMRRLRSIDDYSAICLSLNHEVCFLLQAKADVNQIHFSWNLLFQSPPSVVSAYMALFSPFL